MTRSKRPGAWRYSAVAGALVMMLVLLVGGVLLGERSERWAATASVVVLPSRTLDPGSAAGYYETLSRGQMVETIAEIVRLPQFVHASEDELRVRPADRAKVSTSVGVVPNTALITATVTAGSPDIAESLANRELGRATDYLSGLNSPYVLDSVSSANGTAKRSGLSTGGLLVALFIGALALGLATQQLFHQLVVERAPSRPRTEVAPPSRGAPPDEPAMTIDQAPESPLRHAPAELGGSRDSDGHQAPDGPGLQPVGPWSET